MGVYIGIDLGTTYSVVAYLDETGRPTIIDNPSSRDGNNITASNVALINGEVVVGNRARQRFQGGKNAVGRFKRDMGTNAKFSFGDGEMTPTELSALVLREMRRIAEEEVGSIEKAVVTIPANFSNKAREDTLKAAKDAGLEIDFIINEPTAAALYYAFESEKECDGIYAIYDLGGGTFDVSIINVSGQDVDILASNGLAKLGGDDFDRALQQIVKQKYKEALGEMLENYEYTLTQAEVDKISLSTRRKCIAGGDGEVGDGSHTISIARSDFEKAISSLLAQTEILCEATLAEAEVTNDKVKEVILVGGSTRIPAVRESVRRVFEQLPVIPENVDEMVALGAALYAAHKSDKSSLSSIQKQSLKRIGVSDVSNHYFGTFAVKYNERTEQTELSNSILIEKNSKLPCSVTESFSTMHDGQDAINTTVTQSGSPETDPKFVTVIWEGKLDLPPGRPAGQPIEITYSYDENQIMHCEFLDVESGRKKEVKLDQSGSSTNDDDGIDKFLVE